MAAVEAGARDRGCGGWSGGGGAVVMGLEGDGGGRWGERRGHAGGLGTAQTQPCSAAVHTETDWLAGRSQAGEQHASSSHTQETRAVVGGGGRRGRVPAGTRAAVLTLGVCAGFSSRYALFRSGKVKRKGGVTVLLCDVTKGSRYWSRCPQPGVSSCRRTHYLFYFFESPLKSTGGLVRPQR